jgi:anaphase-promoting complex subunit 6
MEHTKLHHWTLAEEFLKMALASCATDPLVFNELGVLYYNKKK